LAVFALLVGLLLHRTVFGRWVFSVGTNEKASYFSGVPTARVKVAVFAISGLMAAMAGFLIDSRLGVARFDHGKGLEVDVIAAVVVGGASIYGGVGTVLGSMIALLLIALIRTGMGVANIGAEYQLAAVGALLIVAVLIGNVSERWPRPKTLKINET
jgi:rhamnose transport system permease protein